ncbi:hypothetical protein B0H13DRAFT_2260605 [Mycena leptocephala]|nr:hypothetical protein B0H13DRAFT_2260605 [Mycena leptocephala]
MSQGNLIVKHKHVYQLVAGIESPSSGCANSLYPGKPCAPKLQFYTASSSSTELWPPCLWPQTGFIPNGYGARTAVLVDRADFGKDSAVSRDSYSQLRLLAPQSAHRPSGQCVSSSQVGHHQARVEAQEKTKLTVSVGYLHDFRLATNAFTNESIRLTRTSTPGMIKRIPCARRSVAQKIAEGDGPFYIPPGRQQSELFATNGKFVVQIAPRLMYMSTSNTAGGKVKHKRKIGKEDGERRTPRDVPWVHDVR